MGDDSFATLISDVWSGVVLVTGSTPIRGQALWTQEPLVLPGFDLQAGKYTSDDV